MLLIKTHTHTQQQQQLLICIVYSFWHTHTHTHMYIVCFPFLTEGEWNGRRRQASGSQQGAVLGRQLKRMTRLQLEEEVEDKKKNLRPVRGRAFRKKSIKENKQEKRKNRLQPEKVEKCEGWGRSACLSILCHCVCRCVCCVGVCVGVCVGTSAMRGRVGGTGPSSGSYNMSSDPQKSYRRIPTPLPHLFLFHLALIS